MHLFLIKTGTLTIGSPKVTNVKYYGKLGDTLAYLKAVESESDHPLANAVVDFIDDVKEFEVSETHVVKGGGITAIVNGKTYCYWK